MIFREYQVLEDLLSSFICLDFEVTILKQSLRLLQLGDGDGFLLLLLCAGLSLLGRRLYFEKVLVNRLPLLIYRRLLRCLFGRGCHLSAFLVSNRLLTARRLFLCAGGGATLRNDGGVLALDDLLG